MSEDSSDTHLPKLIVDRQKLAESGFSPREIDVLEQILQGKTKSIEIALALHISENTVRNIMKDKSDWMPDSPFMSGISGKIEKIAGEYTKKSGWARILFEKGFAKRV